MHWKKDHPRGCGENNAAFEPPALPIGSPPRMRGKPNVAGIAARQGGITPADAGKTRTCLLQVGKPQDHPRGCGENRATLKHFPLQTGSPPRMRGKPVRILSRCGAIKDHPRGCGENPTEHIAPGNYTGSPPRMRGKPSGKSTDTATLRITPADAGKTKYTDIRAENL